MFKAGLWRVFLFRVLAVLLACWLMAFLIGISFLLLVFLVNQAFDE